MWVAQLEEHLSQVGIIMGNKGRERTGKGMETSEGTKDRSFVLDEERQWPAGKFYITWSSITEEHVPLSR